ncbi:hypothetical protein M0805_006035 [Coniferiporia weirii]|nr:hypothetical protein M0805_006035 [Coniferiporia weirii]
MSRLSRLLPPVAAARRTYSIFSSKSGGGRYFNSAKPTKAITSSTAAKPNPSPGASTSHAGSAASPEAPDAKSADGVSVPQQQQSMTDARHPFVPPNTLAAASGVSMMDFAAFSPHPTLKPNELMLHRFFAMHRPCLLLNQPTSSLFVSAPLLPTAEATAVPPAPLGTIDDPPVASPEADANAARRLSRSLVMNRVGNLVDWEGTLARLGLHEMKEPVPPMPAGIGMDSTKRKRRKKMKKHKLKKRRRLSRATRLRMGK